MTDFAGLPPLKLALLARRLEPQLRLSLAEPIAIVGLGMRLPGGATPEQFWSLLAAGEAAIAPILPSRWDLDAYHDPVPGTPGKMYVRHGAFIDPDAGVEAFDPQFFGIAPREAAGMDPHQRVLLEVAWEAFERAGIAASSLRRSNTGVFIGMMNEDFSHLMQDVREIGTHTASGSGMSVAAGRLAYLFGLEGPTIAVDTACSSSLVSVHLACQSLRTHECDLALAGGVSLILSPLTTLVGCASRMLSLRGRCHTFDERADGFVRGEGCGLLVLRRLSDALAHGDTILALVRGSAVNHSGRTSGLTVPRSAALTRVIQAAMRAGGVTPAQVGYVEAHGTGTAIGDPIELEALGQVFAECRGMDDPLPVGSVKTNIGHTEGAAGIAGILKVVLALEQQQIPRHLNCERPNPAIRWDQLPLTVPREPRPWPRAAGRRIAGVTAFGFNGTNAHVLIEEPPLPAARPELGADPQLLLISARSPAALRALALGHAAALALPALRDPEVWADHCFTAATGRDLWPHRLTLVAATAADARDLLLAFLRGDAPAGLWHGVAGREPASPHTTPEPHADRRAFLAQRAATAARGPLDDASQLFPGPRRKRSLPTYPFERTRYWFDPPASAAKAPAPPDLAATLDLLDRLSDEQASALLAGLDPDT